MPWHIKDLSRDGIRFAVQASKMRNHLADIFYDGEYKRKMKGTKIF